MDEPRDLLSQLALKYGTDKFRDHHYTPHYHRHFKDWRTEPIALLEIGVAEGKSLRMWRDYFVAARIHGLDIEDKGIEIDKVNIIIGDATSWETEELVTMFGPYHIIIDDGSHMSQDIVTTFSHFWPSLAEGGWYVIEDLACDFNPAFHPQDVFGVMDELCLRAAEMHQGNGPICAIEMYREIAFIQKGREGAWPPNW